jgi:hypothetical protein
MLAWMFFLGSPGSAVIPAIILAIASNVLRRNRLEHLGRRSEN